MVTRKTSGGGDFLGISAPMKAVLDTSQQTRIRAAFMEFRLP
jgi:hypothetical protein